MIVHKFGGATTRTARGLETLVEVVRKSHLDEVERAKRKAKEAGELPGLVVVISAIGHTTRNLARAAELSEQGHAAQAEEALSRVLAQHQQITQALQLQETTKSEIFREFQQIVAQLSALLEGISITRELSVRTKDTFLSAGEKFSQALIERLLRERGLPVVRVEATEVIITNDDFTRARPIASEIEQRAKEKIFPHLRHAEIVLVQGFVGATRDGATTTMGSESSDLTATLLAKALAAREVIIWKTVPGIFSADPELIPKAKLVRNMTFEEADELGRRGARILFQNIASPFIDTPGLSSIRVASPKSFATRSTVIEAAVAAPRRAKPLAIATESGLTPIVLTQKNLRASAAKNPAMERRREETLRTAVSRAAFSLSTETELKLYVRREAKPDVNKELAGTGAAYKEEVPVSALSLTYRKGNGATASQDEQELASQILRSLRQFEILGHFHTENSIVTFLHEPEMIPAMRKLHRDLFGS